MGNDRKVHMNLPEELVEWAEAKAAWEYTNITHVLRAILIQAWRDEQSKPDA